MSPERKSGFGALGSQIRREVAAFNAIVRAEELFYRLYPVGENKRILTSPRMLLIPVWGPLIFLAHRFLERTPQAAINIGAFWGYLIDRLLDGDSPEEIVRKNQELARSLMPHLVDQQLQEIFSTIPDASPPRNPPTPPG